MKHLFTLFMCVTVSLAVLVGVSRAFGYDRGFRGRNLAEWILFEMRRNEALQHRKALMNRMWEMKTSAIDEFIANGTTVQHVIEQFEEAEELLQDDNEGVVPPYQRTQTKARMCRQLVGWVQDELKDDPEKAQQVVRRLKEELADEPDLSGMVQ
jgi:hypothetical protein